MTAKVPTRLKIINGDKEDRINRDEPAAKEMTRIPVCPSWMTISQTVLFKQVCRELLSMRMLYSADLDCVIAYVVAADTCNRVAALVNELDSLITVSDKGVLHPHPYLMMLDRAQNRMALLARQFGLTPLARTSLRLGAVIPNTEAGHETPAAYFAGA
jgi:P27 family predicted phage terminase small subunit